MAMEGPHIGYQRLSPAEERARRQRVPDVHRDFQPGSLETVFDVAEVAAGHVGGAVVRFTERVLARLPRVANLGSAMMEGAGMHVAPEAELAE
jgi:hypothetical protein